MPETHGRILYFKKLNIDVSRWSNNITYNQIWHCFSFNIYCNYGRARISHGMSMMTNLRRMWGIKNINFFFLGYKIKLTIVQMLSIRFQHGKINCLFWIWRYKNYQNWYNLKGQNKNNQIFNYIWILNVNNLFSRSV